MLPHRPEMQKTVPSRLKPTDWSVLLHFWSVWQVEDKYNLLGGVIGAFITITVIRSMGSLGPARAVMLIVISQLAVAYLIELLGIFGVERADFQWRKLLGMLICIAGVVIFKWK